MKPSITPEIIEALATLRYDRKISAAIEEAVNILDNAGIFVAIDEATGYDVDPEPERVSKCTCTQLHRGQEAHDRGCPGDPAEWGDTAYTTAPKRRQCPNQGCTGEFTVNKDGSLRAHTNDTCQPCTGDRQENTRKLIQSAVNLKF